MNYDTFTDYGYATLTEVKPDPIDQFSAWMEEARTKTDDPRYNAMVLTTSLNDKPTSRVVLLKRHSSQGFVFISHYDSRKGREIDQNKNVSLLFYWSALEREIRIEGVISKTTAEDSDTMFYERPRLSQIATLVSTQSKPLASRELLEQQFQEACEKYSDTSTPIPRPDCFGGYSVKPESFEFWQGGVNRLNHRFLYEREKGDWAISLLYS